MVKMPASDFDDPLPPEVEDLVRAEVDPGERLAWVGRPRPGRYFLRMLPLFFFGIPWTAFSVFWVIAASSGMRGAGAMGIIAPLFGLPFVAVGVGMLAAPFWSRSRAGQVAYAVTDRRVIFLEPHFPSGRKVVSLRPGEIGLIERVERDDGTGDLSFGLPFIAAAGGGSPTTPRRFVGIPQVREVESLIRSTLLEKRAGDA